MESEYFYIVVKAPDGSLVTFTEMPEEGLTATRPATTQDMYLNSKQIIDEVDKNDLALRVAELVASRLAPKADSVSDKIKDALKERGIDPASVSPKQ